ncbi:alpha/beta hydrolase family protein [Nonomuraea ferruginea]|uniref:Alpha/beta fold hydrolase n=1 Tax=Nonomuraea ferruginea TaxID=46174 RepID=A0ABT4SUE3_9ACTN|nr:prolyl oligopeptidase family serine peptidase [Nonomuraea ferruginea]MDA0640660.1 alpha/beta fold hydrolase [Nonomuraea ferruginea]
MASERRPRRWRRRAWIAAGVALAVLVAGLGYSAWFGSDQAIKVRRWGAGDVMVLASGDRTVTLADTPATRKPGTYWLEWSGAGTMLGEVTSRGGGKVTRAVLDGAVPSIGTSGSLNVAPPGDPEVAWGLDYSEITVPTELGPAPAWHVPGDGTTWFVAVHGQNARRKAVQKVLPVVHRLGMPFLAITYRNDEGAPASPDGLIHLGDTEWRDLEAAVRTARGLGARRVVLYGTSMGGVVAGQFLARSPLADLVSAVIMDAPPYDLERVSEWNAARFGMPAFAGWFSSRVVEWRIGVDQDALHLIRHPPAVRPPLLLIHTDDDTEVPVGSSRELAAAGPRLGWDIRYEEFPGGDHTEAWNVDRPRYDRLVRDFLTAHAGAVP